MNADTRLEKLALLCLAGLTLAALTGIAFSIIHAGRIDSSAAAILGVIIGVFATFSKDIIQTLRSYSTSEQLGKVTDQLAASGPVTPDPAPKDAQEAADIVAGAADDAADTIKEKTS